MNELIKESRGKPVTTSRKVAEKFDKNHDDVLKSIRTLIDSLGNFSEPNATLKFEVSTYKNRGKSYPEYIMDRDAFTLLAMGFTGKRALKWKIQYIQAFNEMEYFIKSLQTAKLEFPAFTNAIMEAHEEPKHYHFSNEINMINKIVLGVTAAKYKELRGIDKKVPSIRPYVDTYQISMIEELQRIDIGLIVSGMEYEQRKATLKKVYEKRYLSIAV